MPTSGSSPIISNGHSPRSRRSSRPLPFTLAMPQPQPQSQPQHTSQGHQPATFHLFDQGYSNSPSRPQSPSFHRSAAVQVHQVLYGGARRDPNVIQTLVKDMYDAGAVFENPVTIARGQDAIADLFSLLGVVPGEMWSELGEICESPSYLDGSRLLVMSHTFHYRLLGNSSPPGTSNSSTGLHPVHSFYSYSSLPTTPYPGSSQVPLPTTTIDSSNGGSSTHLPLSQTHLPAKEDGKWPLSRILALLRPRVIIDHLSTVHLKMHSRLVFNEFGKIAHHEDVIGFKETVEALVPVLGAVYSLNRQGVGFLAQTASRVLLGKQRQVGGVGEDEEGGTGMGGAGLGPSASGGGGGGGLGSAAQYHHQQSLYHQQRGFEHEYHGGGGGSGSYGAHDAYGYEISGPPPPSSGQQGEGVGFSHIVSNRLANLNLNRDGQSFRSGNAAGGNGNSRDLGSPIAMRKQNGLGLEEMGDGVGETTASGQGKVADSLAPTVDMDESYNTE
ncbi:hypothetical protein T439DRAFT_376181 [Meredithblackwellia eburnea MCA 4105]